MNDYPGDLRSSVDAARAASLLQRLRDAAGRPGAAPSPETLAIQEALSRLAVIERAHLRASTTDAPQPPSSQDPAPQHPAPRPAATQAPDPHPPGQKNARPHHAGPQTAGVHPAVDVDAHVAETRPMKPTDGHSPLSQTRHASPQGEERREASILRQAGTVASDPDTTIRTGLSPTRAAGSGVAGREQPSPISTIPLSRRMSEAVSRALGVSDAGQEHAETGGGSPDGATVAARSEEARARLLRLIKPAATAGLVIIGLVFGVAGTWASLAPLAGAAIATGVVSPDGSRKTIQHLEGGIIKEILIREGDTVSAGQILYRLEVTQAQANYSARREQWLRLVATRARLDAHAQDAPRMTLPAEVTRPDNGELRAFVENQQQLFELRRRGLEERENILRQQLRQLEEQTRGKRLENEGLDLQLKLLEEEAEDKATLVRQRLARKPEYLAIQRSIAEVKSRMGSNIATIGSLEERMGEISLQVNAARTQFRDQNAELLMKTNNDLAQIEESLISTQDILRRTEILAPASGTVLNMRFRTVGGVVRPGEPVVDLVPKEDVLVVDARLPATDIDVVRSGLPAMVHLVPYLTRDTPMLEGVVTHVGADSNVDQQTGQRFYEIKVRVDRSKLDSLGHTIELSPGMPVEVFVMTRNRTALGYMFEPLTRSFRRAFRED